MEMAIAVMKQSINEPRADKKASPLVGAVLLKPDGTVDTAFRGELRHGDHAEYTLLERKHPGERLDGSVDPALLVEQLLAGHASQEQEPTGEDSGCLDQKFDRLGRHGSDDFDDGVHR